VTEGTVSVPPLTAPALCDSAVLPFHRHRIMGGAEAAGVKATFTETPKSVKNVLGISPPKENFFTIAKNKEFSRARFSAADR